MIRVIIRNHDLTQTDNLSLPFIMPSQAQKHITHNEALLALDALLQLSVLSRTTLSPPTSPTAGDRYLVPSSATGEFAGQEDKIAAYQDGVYQFYAPQTGWLSHIEDEDGWIYFNGTNWVDLPGTGTVANYDQISIHTSSDNINRLALSSDASLFNHNGTSHQLKINKASISDNASLLFQTGYSGRAEFGLSGDDQFRIKVSADGSTFSTALTCNSDHCAFGTPVALPQVSVAQLPSASPAGQLVYVSDASGGAIIGFSDGASWRRCDSRIIIS